MGGFEFYRGVLLGIGIALLGYWLAVVLGVRFAMSDVPDTSAVVLVVAALVWWLANRIEKLLKLIIRDQTELIRLLRRDGRQEATPNARDDRPET